MPKRADGNIANGGSRTPAAIVLEELARRRLSRQGLAERARISLSTLEKALSGRRPFTLATIVRLEEALGVSLRAEADSAPPSRGVVTGQELAPIELGSYSRAAIAWIEGAYVTVRPSFGDSSAVYAYRTEILWDAARSSMVFRESERLDAEYSQQGFVSAPNLTGHLYLVTNQQGQYRLIVVARPSISGEMHGILTTLQAGRGAHLIPVSTPIALVPLKALSEIHFGRIRPTHAAYARYRALLKRTVEEPFALFLST
jgi:transcriptional regulator with XRE-family HTH domain